MAVSRTGLMHSKCILSKKLQQFPKKFAPPEIIGLLDLDWDEFITKQRRLYGGQFWALKRNVAVYFNDVFIGSDQELLEELTREWRFLLPTDEDFYKKTLYMEYVDFLKKSKKVYCYMDITIDEVYVGTMTFQLYSELLPETCEVFRCLCTGEMGENEDGIDLNYKDSQIHRIVKMCWIQGGDIENKIGGGGVSILSPTFSDESYCIGHDRRGVLSMANDGKHTNASQFFITLQPSEWMDQYYVAFGQLVEGVDALKSIEAVETYYEMPKKCIKISNCGVITFEEKGIVAMLQLLMTEEEREKKERLPPELKMEEVSDFSIQSSEKVARAIMKEMFGKAVGEEPSVLTLLSSEETALSLVKELLSKATTSSSEEIAKTILRDVFTKATIRAPIDECDERDATSNLEVARYFQGLYSWEFDPNFEYVTPEMFLSSRKQPGKQSGLVGFAEIEEEIKREVRDMECILPEAYSEESLPVSPPIESDSDVTLSPSHRDVRAVLREIITDTVVISETANRTVNRMMNDAIRVVKTACKLQITDEPNVLANIAKIAREIVDKIESQIKLKFGMEPSEETITEEKIIRNVVSEITDKVLPVGSKEEIANRIVSELMNAAVDLMSPSDDPSSVQIAKAILSETVNNIVYDTTEEINDLLVAKYSFSETVHTDSVPDFEGDVVIT